MAYNPKDFFFKKAKAENYAARSIFKLEEMDARFRILRVGQSVLDLGAAPGSWSQYASQKVGKSGLVVGVDLQPIHLTLSNARFLQADIRTLDFQALELPNDYDVVLSDMAPKTTGIRFTDQVRSLELCEKALEVSHSFLKQKGHFVCKLFHSEEFESFRDLLRTKFERVEILRPKSTRKESKEIFFVGLKKL